MRADAMSPKERFAAFLAGKPMDRFLCVPLILNHAARANGVKIGEYNRNGRLMGQCHAGAWRRYGHDLIAIFSDTAILAEAMGTGLGYLEDDVPLVERPAVPSPGDMGRLITAQAHTLGRLPLFIEAVRTAVAAVGAEVPVSCCVPAPFTTAACLRGTDQFARDLIRNRVLAKRLLALSTVTACDFADDILDAGGIPVIVDPVATGSVLSLRMFEEFAVPYLRELHAVIARRGCPVVLHICGQTSRILDAMVETNANLLSLDDISMAEARDRVGGRVGLMGNVRPAQTLLKGSPEEVAREVRALCEIGRGCPRGFILGSGCEVPIATPSRNIDAMMSAVREYGGLK